MTLTKKGNFNINNLEIKPKVLFLFKLSEVFLIYFNKVLINSTILGVLYSHLVQTFPKSQSIVPLIFEGVFECKTKEYLFIKSET